MQQVKVLLSCGHTTIAMVDRPEMARGTRVCARCWSGTGPMPSSRVVEIVGASPPIYEEWTCPACGAGGTESDLVCACVTPVYWRTCE